MKRNTPSRTEHVFIDKKVRPLTGSVRASTFKQFIGNEIVLLIGAEEFPENNWS